MARAQDPTQINLGAGTLYVATLGSTEPSALTGNWPAGWGTLGYTDAGSTFTITPTVEDVMVAESVEPVGQQMTRIEYQIAFALAQETAANLQLAMNGGDISAPSGGYVTFDPPDPSDQVYVMLGWDDQNSTRRYLWRKCMNRGAAAIAHQGGVQKSTIGCEFHAVVPSVGTKAFKAWFASALAGS